MQAWTGWLLLVALALSVAVTAPVHAKDRDKPKDKEKVQEQARAEDEAARTLERASLLPIVARSAARPVGDSRWTFVDESKPGAPAPTGAQVAVGAQAPTGETAVRFTIGSSVEALTLQNLDPQWRGLRLQAVDRLAYCTYLADAPLPYAVMLELNIDADLSDSATAWQGRLVYEPARNGAVVLGEWQCWDTRPGVWWATGGPVAAFADAQNPQPLAAILARFPNLGLHPRYGGLVLKAGDGWSRFDGYVDGVILSAGERRWLFDFESADSQEQADGNRTQEIRRRVTEQVVSLTDKDACKEGGWEFWGFRNQGQCVAFTNYLRNHPVVDIVRNYLEWADRTYRDQNSQDRDNRDWNARGDDRDD
jgi:hypothetical protein